MAEKFDIMKMDCEERFGFAAAGMTTVGKFSSMIPGVILTAVIYGILSLLKIAFLGSTWLEKMKFNISFIFFYHLTSPDRNPLLLPKRIQ